MKKYLMLYTLNLQSVLENRFNFLLERVQNILLLLTFYFLWSALFRNQATIFGYSQQGILTYVIASYLLRSFIINTRTKYIGEEIYNGTINQSLLKPISFFGRWLVEDFALKTNMLITSIFEISVFLILVKPPLFLQVDLSLIFVTLIALSIAALLNFMVNFIAGLLGFWSTQVYGPHFLVELVIDFASGSLFPLDVLPLPIFNVLKMLPFYYVVFFPLKIYLGQLTLFDIWSGLVVQILWLILLLALYRILWQKGLKHYSAVGG